MLISVHTNLLAFSVYPSCFGEMEDKEWVLVQRSTEKDWWNPSLMEDNNDESSKPLKVTFSGPAKHWTDAIPIGNGRHGAMIWGGVALETLQLNGD